MNLLDTIVVGGAWAAATSKATCAVKASPAKKARRQKAPVASVKSVPQCETEINSTPTQQTAGRSEKRKRSVPTTTVPKWCDNSGESAAQRRTIEDIAAAETLETLAVRLHKSAGTDKTTYEWWRCTATFIRDVIDTFDDVRRPNLHVLRIPLEMPQKIPGYSAFIRIVLLRESIHLVLVVNDLVDYRDIVETPESSAQLLYRLRALQYRWCVSLYYGLYREGVPPKKRKKLAQICSQPAKHTLKCACCGTLCPVDPVTFHTMKDFADWTCAFDPQRSESSACTCTRKRISVSDTPADNVEATHADANRFGEKKGELLRLHSISATTVD